MKITEQIILQEYLQSFQIKCRGIVDSQPYLFSLLYFCIKLYFLIENIFINLVLPGQDVVPQCRSNIFSTIKLEPGKSFVAERVLSIATLKASPKPRWLATFPNTILENILDWVSINVLTNQFSPCRINNSVNLKCWMIWYVFLFYRGRPHS